MEKVVQIMRNRWRALTALAMLMFAVSANAAEFRKVDGTTPPMLILKDIKGNKVDLSSYKGQVVLVNFWATWCPPCREEMPSMQRLKEKMVGRPFVILGVASAEAPEDMGGFLDRIKVNFTILFDPDGSTTKRWKIYGLPTSFLIDKEGKIRYILMGTKEWDEKEAVSLIESMLQQ